MSSYAVGFSWRLLERRQCSLAGRTQPTTTAHSVSNGVEIGNTKREIVIRSHVSRFPFHVSRFTFPVSRFHYCNVNSANGSCPFPPKQVQCTQASSAETDRARTTSFLDSVHLPFVPTVPLQKKPLFRLPLHPRTPLFRNHLISPQGAHLWNSTTHWRSSLFSAT